MDGKRLADGLIGLVDVELAVVVEADERGGVDKVVAEIFGHHARREILPARNQLVDREALVELLAQPRKVALDVHLKIEFALDVEVARLDHGEDLLAGDGVLQVRMAQIEQIGDLVVVLVALARGGNHDEPARRVG